MLSWALTFLIIALIAGALGFGGIPYTSAGVPGKSSSASLSRTEPTTFGALTFSIGFFQSGAITSSFIGHWKNARSIL